MFKKIIRNQRIMGALLLAALTAYLIVHILVLNKRIPYSQLWGRAVTGSDSLEMAEGFAIFFILVFMAGVALMVWSNTPSFFKRFRGKETQRRLLTGLGNAIGYCMAAYMFLCVIGYLRANVLSLKIIMSLVCLAFGLWVLWVLRLGKALARRRRQRMAARRKQRRSSQ